MSKNITIAGATYPNVPAIDVKTSEGGTARFVDQDDLPTIQKYYTGSAVPTASFGNDGDLYLKVGS